MTIDALRTHPMFSLRDLAYLTAKGYSHAEIKAFWDRDLADGAGPVQWKGRWNEAKFRRVTGQGGK